MEYQYPIDYSWSTDEVVDVIKFFEYVEKAYEKGVDRDEFLAVYRRFKEIIPGKADEKNICGEFEDISGYSSYRTVKAAKEAEAGKKIKVRR
ncbi:UPF0223 family protein [Mesobacillus harenae]|uniref:UPF0223 family protein n=1 Tax=Mesobacillus harenae TaxID=2213203 RepID=UPI0015808ADA|nr:UPF0223 family protein [Mesobacillus harenae]